VAGNRLIKCSICLFLIFIAVACSKEAREQIGEMKQISTAISGKFNVQNVGIGVTNKHLLQISLINSRFNNFPEDDKNKLAEELAYFAFTKLEKIRNIDEIWVAFTVYKKTLFSEYKNSLDNHVFKVSVLVQTKKGR
jgi:hypothetical protein